MESLGICGDPWALLFCILSRKAVVGGSGHQAQLRVRPSWSPPPTSLSQGGRALMNRLDKFQQRLSVA